jgi:hypothetical protein
VVSMLMVRVVRVESRRVGDAESLGWRIFTAGASRGCFVKHSEWEGAVRWLRQTRQQWRLREDVQTNSSHAGMLVRRESNRRKSR